MKNKSDKYGNMETFNGEPNPSHQKSKRDIVASIGKEYMEFFCKENGENIVACHWYNTHLCLESCKFYRGKVEAKKGEVDRAKRWHV